jgi:hypothetical protein
MPMVQFMHDNWDTFKDLRPSKLADALLDAEILDYKRNSELLRFVSNWKNRVPALEYEGLWTPLRITNVDGWVSEVSRMEKSRPEDIETGRIIGQAMMRFLELLGGKFYNNAYYSPVRGIICKRLQDEIIRFTGKEESYALYKIIETLCLYGALRRMTTTPRIIMIPTPEQMIATEKIAERSIHDFWGAHELQASSI